MEPNPHFQRDLFEKNKLTVGDLVVNSLVNEWNHPRTSPAKREELALKFAEFIATANIVCREDFYPFTHLFYVPTQVFFFPTSESYELYGPALIVDITYGDEIYQIKENYNASPVIRTQGYLRAECVSAYQVKQLNTSQLNQLETQGFHTRDVYRIINA
jgi:hypothetical protein